MANCSRLSIQRRMAMEGVKSGSRNDPRAAVVGAGDDRPRAGQPGGVEHRAGHGLRVGQRQAGNRRAATRSEIRPARPPPAPPPAPSAETARAAGGAAGGTRCPRTRRATPRSSRAANAAVIRHARALLATAARRDTSSGRMRRESAVRTSKSGISSTNANASPTGNRNGASPSSPPATVNPPNCAGRGVVRVAFQPGANLENLLPRERLARERVQPGDRAHAQRHAAAQSARHGHVARRSRTQTRTASRPARAKNASAASCAIGSGAGSPVRRG